MHARARNSFWCRYSRFRSLHQYPAGVIAVYSYTPFTRGPRGAGRSLSSLIDAMLPPVRWLQRFCEVYPVTATHLWRTTSVFVTLSLGFGVFHAFHREDCGTGECARDLTAIDSLYFTIVTISTVGYGDITPSSSGMRAFTIAYVRAQQFRTVQSRMLRSLCQRARTRLIVSCCCKILIGVGYVFVQLANLFTGLLKAYSTAVKRFLDMFDRTEASVDTTGDGQKELSVSGRSLGLSGHQVDLTGDGQTDFILPPSAFTFWAQELLPAVLLLTAVQLASAAIFTALLPELDFGHAFYHCMITATTVGYGDVPMRTQGARLFASVHIVVSVSCFAAVVSAVDTLRHVRRSQLARAALITKPPRREQIMGYNADHHADGVDRLEFVLGMMMHLGVELCGEPLKWEDVRPFTLQFDRFDVSQTGRVSSEDLDEYLKKVERRAEKASNTVAQNRGGAFFARTRRVRPAVQFSRTMSMAVDGSRMTQGRPADRYAEGLS